MVLQTSLIAACTYLTNWGEIIPTTMLRSAFNDQFPLSKSFITTSKGNRRLACLPRLSSSTTLDPAKQRQTRESTNDRKYRQPNRERSHIMF